VSKKGIKANPEKNQCSSTHEAFTIKKKRSAKPNRQNSSLEQVHVEAGKANPTIFHSA
jgi:hypothetical protein